ncbi:MAG: AraC family transcriptional regulator [Eubacteriales bacterium]
MKKTLVKYFNSYILLLFLPIFTLSFYIQTNLLQKLEDQYEHQLRQSLVNKVSHIENTFHNLDFLKTHMESNLDLLVAKRLEDVVAVKLMMEELNKYSVSNPYVEDIIVYFQGDQYAYSTLSSYKIENLFQENYYFKDWAYEDFQKTDFTGEFQIHQKEIVFFSGSNQKMIVCSTETKLCGESAVLFFIVDFQKFSMGDSKFLISTEGKILYENSRDIANDVLTETLLQEELEEDYIRVSVNSGAREYIEYYPASHYLKEFQEIQTVFYVILLVLLVIGVLLLYGVTVLNYRPMLLFHKQSEKAQEMEFMRRILAGQVSTEEYEEFRQVVGNQDCLYVILFAVSNPKIELLELDKLQKETDLFCSGRIISRSKKGEYTIISSGQAGEDLGDLAQKLWKHFETVLESPVALTVSSLASSVEELPRLYHKALSTLEYRFVRGKSGVIEEVQFSDFQEEVFPYQLITRLKSHIVLGNIAEIERTMDEFSQYITTCRLSLFYIKGICYQLLEIFADMFLQYNLVENHKENSFYASGITEFETVEQLITTARQVAKGIATLLQEQNKDRKKDSLQNMTEYLSSQALSPNFSVQQMAKEFDLAPASLSSQYKENTGVSITDAVTKIRMERAIHLLSSTDLTLNAVVLEVGYYNTSSFIRKFKSIYQMTPGQYIKAKQNERR